MTWAKQIEDYAANCPAHPERSAKGVDKKTTYSEGVLVGYRWFDDQRLEPLFPFGFGLSYTRFEISGNRGGIHSGWRCDRDLTREEHWKHSGRRGSSGLPRCAESEAARSAVRPRKTLVAFDRVTLKAGEGREITMHVGPRAFQYWSTATGAWVKTSGERTLRAGPSSRDLPLSAILR